MVTLKELVEGASLLIFDFDGPVCSVFAGYPPERVAAAMIKRALEITDAVPPEIKSEQDPMEVLVWSGLTGNLDLINALDEVLSAAESEAVRTAETTLGFPDVVRNAAAAGLQLAIASNNNVLAIDRFMNLHREFGDVTFYAGRPPGHPELMKPDPRVLISALEQFERLPSEALFVGDSLSDITAARLAKMPVIAYANKAPKIRLFRGAEPDAVIVSMNELADALALR